MQAQHMLSTNRLTSAVEFRGTGLFTGKPCRCVVSPGITTAERSAGATFERTDVAGPTFPADITSLVSTNGFGVRNTALAPSPHAGTTLADVLQFGVMTTEHLMSALHALLLFDVHIELSGPEIPMMDNSALPFFDLLAHNCAPGGPALSVLDAGESVIGPGDQLTTRSRTITDASLKLRYLLEYPPDAHIPQQSAQIELARDGSDEMVYSLSLAGARTFCTKQEADAMQTSGKFAHVKPGDVLVIGPDGPIGTRYRMATEPAAHKTLDLLGDLYLAGRPVVGSIIASQTGHRHNHALVTALLAAERDLVAAATR